VKRITEEEFGLLYSAIVLIALLAGYKPVAILFSAVLILIFLFKLSYKKKK